MRIHFSYNRQQVSPTWDMPAIPAAGNYVQWKLGGGIPEGLYRVQEVVWQLDGTITACIMLSFVGT